MRIIIIVQQVALVCLWIISSNTICSLEIGFVTILGHPSKYDHPNKDLNQTISVTKSEKETVAINSLLTKHPAHSHVWIPGQVRHHAFIPAHIHHIFVPGLLVARTVHTVLLKMPKMEEYDGFYGGYGVGSDVGGQGAGHGYQIVFNP